jgi:hypothetical protein
VYHSLNLLHMFISDFGPQLAKMPAVFPDAMPTSVSDNNTLRWTVRTDGKSGFIFINNYQRGQDMPARDVRLGLKLPTGSLSVPAQPKQIPANTFMIWPFNLDLNGITLTYATAQLLCRLDEGGTPVFVFFTPDEMSSRNGLSFDGASLASIDGVANTISDASVVLTPTIGHETSLRSRDGRLAKVLVLNQFEAMHLWKAHLWGADRLVMSDAELSFDGDNVIVTSRNPGLFAISVFPPPAKGLVANGTALPSSSTLNPFTKYDASASVPAKQVVLQVTKTKDAGPARALVLGTARTKPQVPTEPTDADFDAAGVWQVSVPADALTGLHEVYVKIDYAGDAARAYIGDQFIDDDFYFGQPWEIGIKRFSPAISDKGLTIKALPLRKDSPVYLEPDKVPQFDAKGEALEIRSITAVPEYQLTIQAAP